MPPIKIFLINIYDESKHTLPLGLGYLKTYAESLFKNQVQIEIKEYSKSETQNNTKQVLNDIIIKSPDVIGFSCYIWNREAIIYIAPLVKKMNKNIKIIIGGKETSINGEILLKKSQADAVIIGEGEIPFSDIIHKTILKHSWENIPSSIIKKSNKIIKNEGEVFLDKLDSIPSPYLNGIFDNNNSDYLIIETTRGCQFKCPFCLWTNKKKLRTFSVKRVLKEIDWIINNSQKINKNRLKVIISDADFFIKPLRAKKIIKHITSYNKEIDWSITTNIKFIKKEILGVLNNHHIKLSIGIQSINPKSIKILNRENLSLSKKEMEKKLNMISRYAPKSTIILEIMIGIPGERPENFEKTLKWSMERCINHIIKTKNEREKNEMNAYIDYCTLSIFPGTPMVEIAKKYRAKWMKEPPYEILSTPLFTHKKINMYKNIASNMENIIKENFIKINSK